MIQYPLPIPFPPHVQAPWRQANLRGWWCGWWGKDVFSGSLQAELGDSWELSHVPSNLGDEYVLFAYLTYWWFQPLRKKSWNICHWGSSKISILYDCFAFFMFISTNGFNHRNHQPNWVSDTSSTSFHVQSPAMVITLVSQPRLHFLRRHSANHQLKLLLVSLLGASSARHQAFGILFANPYYLPSTINIYIIYELWSYDSPCNKNNHEPSFFIC